ncbi:hypothetical protein [Capnocytophaga canis]|uniref:hypothetical protein n=1 Tax=Capnocytophaga canis TaxID=1848903 RepID=UPI0037CFD1EC
MITLKTKQKHQVPFNRGTIETEVYLKISDLRVDENGVVPHGYYYIIQNEQPHQLDKIVPSILLWERVEQAETQLSAFTSNSLKNAIYQRATEFAIAKLQQEGTQNYGIDSSDWEIYIAPPPTEPVQGETEPEKGVNEPTGDENEPVNNEPENEVGDEENV